MSTWRIHLLAACALGLGLARLTLAQVPDNTPPAEMNGAQPGPGGAWGHPNGPWHALNLTETQKSQLHAVLGSTQPQMQALRDRLQTDRAANKADAVTADQMQLRALHEETQRKVEAILTPTQLAQLKALQSERREERESGHQL